MRNIKEEVEQAKEALKRKKGVKRNTNSPYKSRKKYVKLSETIVKKLEEAFSIGATIEEACFYANVSRQTFYNWIDKDEKLKERFDILKQKPILKARMTIANHLNETETAKWYLERKRKGEFSLRQEMTGADGKDLTFKWVGENENNESK